jgi:NADH dehydrogenase/NADH:ubiquinone oxidoreductase subunit G
MPSTSLYPAHDNSYPDLFSFCPKRAEKRYRNSNGNDPPCSGIYSKEKHILMAKHAPDTGSNSPAATCAVRASQSSQASRTRSIMVMATKLKPRKARVQEQRKGQKAEPRSVPKAASRRVVQEHKGDAAIFYAGHQKRKYNQTQVIHALVAADGALTIAAKRLGTSYRHLKKYIDANKRMADVLHGIEESILDLAEGTLRKTIEEGDLAATIFFLKTKGKRRGYTEHDKQDASKLMQPVTIVYHSPRDPERLQHTEHDGDDKGLDAATS